MKIIGKILRLIRKIGPFQSQKGQDRWVIFRVLPWKRRGYFVELAAADGVRHSNTYALEKVFGWRGLCIEANPAFLARAMKRRDCEVVRAAVSDRRERVMFRIDNGQAGGIVADDTDNNSRIRGAELQTAETFEIDTVTLTELLDQYGAPSTIDYLSLDVEGSEERVMRGLDFDRYSFKCLTIERPTPAVNDMLFSHGYVFVRNRMHDSFYVHPDVLAERNIKPDTFEQIPAKDW